jgi:PAS domain-containing protein
MHGSRDKADTSQPATAADAQEAEAGQVSELLASPELTEALASEHFRRFLDHIPFGVAISKVANGDERIVYVNGAGSQLIGMPLAELVGRPWAVLDRYRLEDDPNETLGQRVLNSEEFLG